MINAFTQSPIVGKKIFEWKEQIENQQLVSKRYNRYRLQLMKILKH